MMHLISLLHSAHCYLFDQIQISKNFEIAWLTELLMAYRDASQAKQFRCDS